MHKASDLLGRLTQEAATKMAVSRPQHSSAGVQAPGVFKTQPSASTHLSAQQAPKYPKSRTYDERIRFRKESDLTLIKGILSKALARKGLDEKVERYEFILHWQDIVGETFAAISKPDHISRKVLLVTVAHSAWAQELAFMKPALLQKLAPYLRKGDVVEDMVFRVGAI